MKARSIFDFISRPLLRTTSLILLFTMTAAIIRGLGQTNAYLSDIETSINNEFLAGSVDFSVTSEVSTSSICTVPGKPLQKIIRVTNFGNPFKYQISAGDFSNDICNYVWLDANLDGNPTEYSGPLTSFDYGLTIFSDPAEWSFTLSISTTTPLELHGQVCEFTLNFGGSQTRHDLPFPDGFSDIESDYIDIQAGYCFNYETRTIGYWKNHSEVYFPHLPQFLGATSTNATGTNEWIYTTEEVNTVFDASDKLMRNKLRKQLLAMKFNIAHFGIGEYIPASSTLTLSDIVSAADDLLRQNPPPSNSVLEQMKNLLDQLNNLHQISICSCEPHPPGNIVINEFLADPYGEDNAQKPGGEWIELYNSGGLPVDVAGWALYDSDDSHELLIGSDNISTTTSIIQPGKFLVVYRNGDLDFSLDNDADTVRLFNGKISAGAKLIDSFVYSNGIAENKSYARIPDGSSNWIDPIPTPGDENYVIYEDYIDETPAATINAAEENEFFADSVATGSIIVDMSDTEFASSTLSFSEPTVIEKGTTESANSLATATAEAALPVLDIASETPGSILGESSSGSESINQLSETEQKPPTIPEEPAGQPISNDTALIVQPLAPIPPEIIVPEAPVIVDSGAGV